MCGVWGATCRPLSSVPALSLACRPTTVPRQSSLCHMPCGGRERRGRERRGRFFPASTEAEAWLVGMQHVPPPAFLGKETRCGWGRGRRAYTWACVQACQAQNKMSRQGKLLPSPPPALRLSCSPVLLKAAVFGSGRQLQVTCHAKAHIYCE